MQIKKHNFNQKKKELRIYFCGILDPAAVQDCTKFGSLIANVLLQLVRDIINGVCYQRYENVLSNKRVVQMLMFAPQKKLWKRNYNQISARLSFQFK